MRLHRGAGRGWPVILLALSGCLPSPASRPAPAESLAAALSGMVWPLAMDDARRLTSSYGSRAERHHDGLDIAAPQGEPIYAAAEGRVLFSGWKNGYGNTVIVAHERGVTTLYAHASARYVSEGQPVRRGEPLAAVGQTGNARGAHLHFEVLWRGAAIDPTPLLPALGGRAAAR